MEFYREQQNKWLTENNVRIGDKVLVSRIAQSEEQGWDEIWTSRMYAFVGCENVTVEKIGGHSEGIYCFNRDTSEGYRFPYFILEMPRATFVEFDCASAEKRFIHGHSSKKGNSVKNKWMPKNGDKVWCLAITDSVIYYDDIYNENTHKTMLNNGLVFRTREQVRKVVREIKNIL
jgi:hypothetical protein